MSSPGTSEPSRSTNRCGILKKGTLTRAINLNVSQRNKARAAKIRDCIFLSSSRKYAEDYIEPFVATLYGLLPRTSRSHDVTIGEAGEKRGGAKKGEIKTCKVLRAPITTRRRGSLADRIILENSNLSTSRLISFSEHLSARYSANVQNIKRDHFDQLIYVLLFSDCVKVFCVNKEDLDDETWPRWSNRHGRYDAFGKNGQFAITNTTIAWHLERYLVDTVTYEELAELYSRM